MSYYVAFSDLRSLNTDSELLDSLRANIKECALLLLEDYVKDISKVSISIEVPFLVNKKQFRLIISYKSITPHKEGLEAFYS